MSRMIQPDTSPPSTPATATPAKNTEIAAARRFAGNHQVRYSTMPGKKPASNTPSRKRST